MLYFNNRVIRVVQLYLKGLNFIVLLFKKKKIVLISKLKNIYILDFINKMSKPIEASLQLHDWSETSPVLHSTVLA